jgi:Protein kinase domain
VLAPYLAPSGTARQRFKREARAAAAVSHDHIVTIHAVDEANGLPFFVMEYVTGVSLQSRLDRDGPLPPRDIARIGMQAANGLAAAHAQGLVHRDVKPANILLENGVERVKITDFGLVWAADDARLTQSGVAAGTPLYMSPEQARGDAVDARSDLFSLGSVLYTLATGFPPFRAGSAMGVLHRIINDPPRRIRDTVPDFPAALEAIIMQLLEKNPARRFESAAEVANRLTEFLAAAPEPPRPRRGWLVAAGLALAAALLLAGVVLTFRTPYGTLVVDVNDPNVKVALDGNELTITGAGTQEVRLKPGTYHVTATDKDGKPAKVSQEVVTIKKDDKEIVKVTVEPAAGLPPVAPRLTAPPPAAPNTVAVPKGAYKLDEMDPEWKAKLDPLMKQFQDLTRRLAGTSAGPLMLLPGPVTDPDKAVASVPEADRERVRRLIALRDQFALLIPRAQAMAVRLNELKDLVANSARTNVRRDLQAMHATLVGQLRDMEKLAAELGAKPSQPGAPPGGSGAIPGNEWEGKLKKLTDEFQGLADRVVKTTPGRVLLTTGPGADPDKATAGLDKDDAFRAKRLLALRDQCGLLVPQAQKGIGRWEKARLAARTADQKYQAGTVPITDLEAARIELVDAERALKVAEDGMTRILTDFKKLADEIEAAASPEGEFKKVMAEFDAIVLRLARHPVGRVLTLVGEKWKEGDLERRGLEPPDVQRAVKLLNLREEIKAQSYKVTSAFSARRQNQENLAKHTGPDPDSEEWRKNITENLRLCEQTITVGTETVRGLMGDLKKLADELDPPKETAETLEADYKRVLAEYDALLLRLVNTKVGRVLALFEKEPISDKYLKDVGVPDAAVPTAWKLFDLRQKVRAQKHDADEHLSRLHIKNNATVPADEHGLKFRTRALRGLVDDLKKLADELDPPGKRADTPPKKTDK